MAQTLTAKPEGAEYRYTYPPPLADGDGLASYTLVAIGCTITFNKANGDDIIISVSGGTAPSIATIAVTVVTNDGETLTETLYIPIRSSANVLANTGQGICDYALRKVYGVHGAIPASAAADCIERLNDMLAGWELEGASVGVPLPVDVSTAFSIADGYVGAIKHNLTMLVAGLYGAQLDGMVAAEARRGLQRIKANNLPDERAAGAYY